MEDGPVQPKNVEDDAIQAQRIKNYAQDPGFRKHPDGRTVLPEKHTALGQFLTHTTVSKDGTYLKRQLGELTQKALKNVGFRLARLEESGRVGLHPDTPTTREAIAAEADISLVQTIGSYAQCPGFREDAEGRTVRPPTSDFTGKSLYNATATKGTVNSPVGSRSRASLRKYGFKLVELETGEWALDPETPHSKAAVAQSSVAAAAASGPAPEKESSFTGPGGRLILQTPPNTPPNTPPPVHRTPRTPPPVHKR